MSSPSLSLSKPPHSHVPILSMFNLSPTFCASLVGTLGGMLYGYNTGIIGGLNTPLIVGTFFPDPSYPPDGKGMSSSQSWLQGILTASILLGGFAGSFIGPPLAERFGRVKGLLACGIIGTICPIIMSIVTSFAALVVIRCLLGVSVGMVGCIGPLYVNEMAPPHRRGMLGTVFQIAVCFSIFIAQVVNYLFNPTDTPAAQRTIDQWKWHVEFLLGMIPGALLIMVILIIPESKGWSPIKQSPSYNQLPLDQTNNPMVDESNGDVNVSVVNRSSSLSVKSSPSPWTILFSLSGAKWLFIGFILSLVNQLTGINSIIFYAPNIFTGAGLSDTLILQFSVVGSWNLCAVFISFALVDRVGRRPLLLFSLSIMCFALFLLGFSYLLFPAQKSVVAILCIILYIGAFEVGPGPLFFLMAVETFPSHLQRQCLSFANALGWVFNIMVTMFFPVINDATSPQFTFFMFGTICAVAIALTFFFLPETKVMQKEKDHDDGKVEGERRHSNEDQNGNGNGSYKILGGQ